MFGSNFIHIFSFIRALGILPSLFPTLVFDISAVLCCTSRSVDWEELEIVTQLEASKGEYSTQGIAKCPLSEYVPWAYNEHCQELMLMHDVLCHALLSRVL